MSERADRPHTRYPNVKRTLSWREETNKLIWQLAVTYRDKATNRVLGAQWHSYDGGEQLILAALITPAAVCRLSYRREEKQRSGTAPEEGEGSSRYWTVKKEDPILMTVAKIKNKRKNVQRHS